MNKHQKISRKGGSAGRGAAKARTSDQARAAAQARWATVAENKALKDQVAALIRAGSNINAEFCSWAPRDVRAPLFEAWDAAVADVEIPTAVEVGGKRAYLTSAGKSVVHSALANASGQTRPAEPL